MTGRTKSEIKNDWKNKMKVENKEQNKENKQTKTPTRSTARRGSAEFDNVRTWSNFFVKIALNRLLTLPDYSAGQCVVVAPKMIGLKTKTYPWW